MATPPLLRAALTAVLLVGVIPLVSAAAFGDGGLVALLMLAPLAPVAAVAFAYRDGSDPTGEISLATPAAGLRLVALRALSSSGGRVAARLPVLAAYDRWIEQVPIQAASPGACPAWRWPRWSCWPGPPGSTRRTSRSAPAAAGRSWSPPS